MISFCRFPASFWHKYDITETGFVQLRENLGKGTFLKKKSGEPGKLREFSDYFYNLREKSGNFILPNISGQIGDALRINEANK